MTSFAKPPWIRKRISPSSLRLLKTYWLQPGLTRFAIRPAVPIWEIASQRALRPYSFWVRSVRETAAFAPLNMDPVELDAEEPQREPEAVQNMRLRYVVITSVTRDDLRRRRGFSVCTDHPGDLLSGSRDKDRGADSRFQRRKRPSGHVLSAQPTVLSHNVETVPSLYAKVRPQADFKRSLDLLKISGQIDHGILVKTGFMLGLGETEDEVMHLLQNLREAECSLLTIGQYLQPRPDLLPVVRYVHPDEFHHYRTKALEMGFKSVASVPFVRSSYRAMDLLSNCDRF